MTAFVGVIMTHQNFTQDVPNPEAPMASQYKHIPFSCDVCELRSFIDTNSYRVESATRNERSNKALDPSKCWGNQILILISWAASFELEGRSRVWCSIRKSRTSVRLEDNRQILAGRLSCARLSGVNRGILCQKDIDLVWCTSRRRNRCGNSKSQLASPSLCPRSQKLTRPKTKYRK